MREDPFIVGTLNANQVSEKLELVAKDLFNGQLRFSQDGSFIVIWGLGKGLHVWDFKLQQRRFANEISSESRVRFVDVAAGSRRIACVADNTQQVVLIDSQSGTTERLIDHPAQVTAIAFSPDGTFVLTACDDGRVRFFILPPDIEHEQIWCMQGRSLMQFIALMQS